MSRLIALHGRRSSLILEPVPGGAPLWRHWGARLEAADLPPLDTRPLSFSPDVVVHRSTAPGFGLGEFGQSILLAHRQGRGFTCAWTECEIEEDERQIIIRLRDTVAGIALEQRLALDADTDLLTARRALPTQGDGELTVDWLAAALLPLPASSTTIRSFTVATTPNSSRCASRCRRTVGSAKSGAVDRSRRSRGPLRDDGGRRLARG